MKRSPIAVSCRLLRQIWEGSEPAWVWVLTCVGLLLADAALTALIVIKVPYTEIDWVAYMQEVAGFLVDGETDYLKLRGDTGPLVYPGGFVWIFSGLYHATRRGEDIRAAQWIFAGVYVCTLGLVLWVYTRARAPTPTTSSTTKRGISSGGVRVWVLPALVLSKRVHSIYVLRMFNDGLAMLLAHAAVLLFTHRQWAAGCVLYSLGVSVKMNVLLFAPGLFLLLLQALGFWPTVAHIALCGAVQLLAGYPFLYTHPVSYLTKAFELGRVFLYQWTVNLRFLSEEVFVSRGLSVLLLVLTALCMLAFARKWGKAQGRAFLQASNDLCPRYVALTLFTSNFIGVAFARSLHYQFYSWYFHSLPLLASASALPLPLQLLVLGTVEAAFNVFPATPASSLALQAAHVCLLVGLWLADPPSPRGKAKGKARKA